ncbi:MAG: hypothetical protein K2Y29_15930 [Beijerinckiaceae bacterium]|nr:hypothetical protein [Beijerinckiaceae bacterium]
MSGLFIGDAKIAKLAALAALALMLAGCNEYLDRRDSISPVTGDAVRQNMVTHVIDPWSRHSRDRNITLSGERAVANTNVTKEAPDAPQTRSATQVSN